MYEAPKMTEVGSVRDLTLGEGVWGRDDSFSFLGFTVHYGTNPSS